MTSTTPPRQFPYSPPPDTGLALVYHDDALLCVNKPSGLLSVPGRGAGMQDCLFGRVLARFPTALVVHRLDEATSGLVLFALSPDVQRVLSRAFETREVQKTYVAVVHGLMAQDEGSINLPLITDWPRRPLQKIDHETGKSALTRWRVLARDAQANTTRVELSPETGRTHQLRVHMQALGHAIVGDALYGGRPVQAGQRLMLHCCALSFAHPMQAGQLDLHLAANF
jgi:tRNA pseudouridine32 synthase / 23S rRNA pseudouridine746 synthase